MRRLWNSRWTLVIVGTVLLVGGCKRRQSTEAVPLLCYVGGTMRPAMERIAELYEQQTGNKTELDFGDSGSNLVRVETERRGDLYVAHDPFLGPLLHRKLGHRGWTLAVLSPVIVVPKGNPKGISGIMDLAGPGIRIGLSDPIYSSLGHICSVMFEKTGQREKIEANIATTMRMGGELANAVAIGRFDAGIVWNAVAHLRRDRLDTVSIDAPYLPDPEVDTVSGATFGPIDMSTTEVFIATLTASKQPDAARRFAEFAASSVGKKVFDDCGFSPASVIPATDHP